MKTLYFCFKEVLRDCFKGQIALNIIDGTCFSHQSIQWSNMHENTVMLFHLKKNFLINNCYDAEYMEQQNQ